MQAHIMGARARLLIEHADGQAIETLTALTKLIPEEAELRRIMRPATESGCAGRH
jgi:hypothetical protein